MKVIILSIALLFAVSGCKEVVSTNETFENAKVTKFNKVNKRQRISFITENDKVYNDFYISKRCAGCAVPEDKIITIRTITRKWDDGTVESIIDPQFIKKQLQ